MVLLSIPHKWITSEIKTRVDVHATTSKDSGFLSKESQESTEKENQKVQEEEPTVSFDELKEKIKAMPKFRPFHSTGKKKVFLISKVKRNHKSVFSFFHINI